MGRSNTSEGKKHLQLIEAKLRARHEKGCVFIVTINIAPITKSQNNEDEMSHHITPDEDWTSLKEVFQQEREICTAGVSLNLTVGLA